MGLALVKLNEIWKFINKKGKTALVLKQYCSEIDIFGEKIKLVADSKEELNTKKVEILKRARDYISQIENTILVEEKTL
jgi:hypothetical protein